MKDWIPLINKLVWPVIIGISLLVFHGETSEIYHATLDRIKKGGTVKVGFFELGAIATKTEIKDLSLNNLSVEGAEGVSRSGGVTKGSFMALDRLQRELAESPKKSINTLLIPDNIRVYSIRLLKEYIGTLGLQYVVYQKNGKFDGWMFSGTFGAQLPAERASDENESASITFDRLRNFSGISQVYVNPDASARDVLEKMQELHVDSLPVVDKEKKWRFFANRGEILARLMTSIIFADGQ
jgi:hypothetical protein